MPWGCIRMPTEPHNVGNLERMYVRTSRVSSGRGFMPARRPLHDRRAKRLHCVSANSPKNNVPIPLCTANRRDHARIQRQQIASKIVPGPILSTAGKYLAVREEYRHGPAAYKRRVVASAAPAGSKRVGLS